MLQDKTKSSMTKTSMHPSHPYHKINRHKKLKPGLVASYDIWPGNGVDYSGRMGRNEKARKQIKQVRMKKGKSKRY